MTDAQKRDAYREAQQILRLDKTWQQIMPGERKPNFRRAAREIIRRALGHKVQRNQTPLHRTIARSSARSGIATESRAGSHTRSRIR